MVSNSRGKRLLPFLHGISAVAPFSFVSRVTQQCHFASKSLDLNRLHLDRAETNQDTVVEAQSEFTATNEEDSGICNALPGVMPMPAQGVSRFVSFSFLCSFLWARLGAKHSHWRSRDLYTTQRSVWKLVQCGRCRTEFVYRQRAGR